MDLALNFDLATDYKLHDPHLPPNLLSFSFQICSMLKKKKKIYLAGLLRGLDETMWDKCQALCS